MSDNNLILDTLKEVGLLDDKLDILTNCKNIKRYISYMGNLADAKYHYDQVDEMMAQIQEGSIVYEEDAIGYGYSKGYPKKVMKIIDATEGIVETFEESINKTEIKCIAEYNI